MFTVQLDWAATCFTVADGAFPSVFSRHFPPESALRGLPWLDSAFGEEGRNVLHGGGHDDLLVGHDQDDELHGDAGNDTLEGGRGDVLARRHAVGRQSLPRRRARPANPDLGLCGAGRINRKCQCVP